MLHVEEATLKEFTEPGHSELEDGTRVSAEPSGQGRSCAVRPLGLTRETAERSRGETSRRISCDCGVVKIGHGPRGQVLGAGEVNGAGQVLGTGEILNAGRRIRTVPPALRRALEARDRGCRFPGCGLRFTEAHHIVHWADGGETSLRNTVLLCRTHHRAVHEGRVRVCMDVGAQVAFFTPRGRILFDAPKTRFSDGAEVAGQGPPSRETEGPGIVGAESARPFTPRQPHLSGAARWPRDTDIPYEIEARAWDALDSG